jgi:hypothetical protein
MEDVKKYQLYQSAVQNVKKEVEFFRKIYRLIYNKVPHSFREDFCGTGLLANEWVKNSVENIAVGIDIDQEALEYGNNNNTSTDRVSLLNHNVLTEYDETQKFDVICSLNYSHFLLTKRSEIKKYFENVFKNISKGIFIIDLFGGSHIYEDHSYDKGDYYRFCGKAINIVNNQTECSLNFKIKKNKYKPLFNFMFRVYSIIELRELLEEIGFKKSKLFLKEINDDEDDDYNEYKEVDINGEYYPESERYNGYIISYV